MNFTRIGIDLAKNRFAVCVTNEHGKATLEKTLKRHELLSFLANVPPCVVAMEAGTGAHYWAREIQKLGHDARIMDPKFVAPYRTGGQTRKNDRNDARAICEAMVRPQAQFVPVKSHEQQALLILHRRRQSLVRDRTRTVNQLRGFLAEFGIVVPRGPQRLKAQWVPMRTTYAEWVPRMAWEEIDALYAHLLELHQQVLAYDRKISALNGQDERAQRLLQINGVGAITASAIAATVGNAGVFKNGRQFAAWLGLTPRQYSTGGVNRLGRITKRGDAYLRTLLIHGARSELMLTQKRDDHKSQWAEQLKQSKPFTKAAVALANKHARIIWAVLAKNESYKPQLAK